MYTYKVMEWCPPIERFTEFYHGVKVLVRVIDSHDDKLAEVLQDFAEETPMSIDLEWKPDRKGISNPISVFQFCSSKGVIVILNSDPSGSPALKSFLESHTFIGKGMSCDQRKLLEMFGHTIKAEDIEVTRLSEHKLPNNFAALAERMLGPPAAEFKDVSVSTSDWSARPLSDKQILYAAYDAYATFHIYKAIQKEFNGPEFIEHKMKLKGPKVKAPKVKKTEKVQGTRSKEQMVKQFKPKFQFDVSYRDVSDFLPFIRTPDEKAFTPRDSYNPRQSMFAHLCAYNEIEKTSLDTYTCHLCNETVHSDDIVGHSWNKHSNRIAQVYFTDQSMKYLQGCFQNIHLAAVNQDTVDGATVCGICRRTFPSFHCYFTHYRLMHSGTADKSGEYDAKTVVVECMERTSSRALHTCCGTVFENEADLKDHCWDQHGEIVAHLLKHRPINYKEETFRRSIDKGVLCINTLAYGEIRHGSITCSFCKIGFDDPGELFVHLFHRHSRLIIVKADQFDQWPLKACDLEPEFTEVLERVCRHGACECAVKEGVLKVGTDVLTCTQCNQHLTESDGWEHLLAHHLILTFEIFA